MPPRLAFAEFTPKQMFRLGRAKKSNAQFFPKRHG
jgi:hypothetical protein